MLSLGTTAAFWMNSHNKSQKLADIVSASNPLVFLDPSDTTSLYMDDQGAIGVDSSNSDVGLVLGADKMGAKPAAMFVAAQPEKVQNGAFDGDLSHWSASSWVYDNGAAKHIGTSGSNLIQIMLEVGKTYKAGWKQLNSGFVSVYGGFVVGDGATKLISNAGEMGDYSRIFIATNQDFMFRTSHDGIKLDDVSIVEVPGNHARQPVGGDRPKWFDVDGLQYFGFNGINHSLNIDFAGGAGPADCSIFLPIKPTSTSATPLSHGTEYTGLTASEWNLIEENGVNLAGLTALEIGVYQSAHFGGDIGSLIIIPTSEVAANRSKIIDTLTQKFGISQ